MKKVGDIIWYEDEEERAKYAEYYRQKAHDIMRKSIRIRINDAEKIIEETINEHDISLDIATLITDRLLEKAETTRN